MVERVSKCSIRDLQAFSEVMSWSAALVSGPGAVVGPPTPGRAAEVRQIWTTLSSTAAALLESPPGAASKELVVVRWLSGCLACPEYAPAVCYLW
jgi:hypothetical protein